MHLYYLIIFQIKIEKLYYTHYFSRIIIIICILHFDGSWISKAFLFSIVQYITIFHFLRMQNKKFEVQHKKQYRYIDVNLVNDK